MKNERATLRDVMISRQSQLKLVMDYCNLCGYCLSMKDIVAISNVLVDYVELGYSKDLENRLQKIDEFIELKKNEL